MGTPEVTVIIPTIGDERRAATIWRAIDSAGPRSGVATRVLVVVNGARYSPALLEGLRAAPGVDCHYREQGSLPLALAAGRALVNSEFFAFLDDDDEILPGGLAPRVAALRADPQAAFVVAAGWRRTGDTEVPQVALDAAAIEADPLGTLLRENWMASCAGLYRSSRVTEEDFRHMPAYLEWTYLGYRLAARERFRFVTTPTFRHYDLPGSVSKSRAYVTGMVPAIEAILALELPAAVRRALRRKLGAAHHGCATLELEEGRRAAAWRHHRASLGLPGGLRYLSFTRHLLGPAAVRSRG